jgi:methylmalonyl-CoA mutase, C-terminal domain
MVVDRPIRVLVAKVGLDGHEVGARVIARGLASEGMEVIYTGIRRTPEQVAAEAIQEDVDVIGVSILSGAHMVLVPRICEQLVAADSGDTVVVVGGIIPDAHVKDLKAAGVAEVFHPGTAIADVAAFIRSIVPAGHRT